MASTREQLAAIPRLFNKTLFLSVGLIAISQFNFRFNQTAYSTTQAMDSFEKQFGYFDKETGEYDISTDFLALLNGLPYIGFVAGKLFLVLAELFAFVDVLSYTKVFSLEARLARGSDGEWSCFQ